jgi:hypothetical protein
VTNEEGCYPYAERNARYWKQNLAVCVFGSFTTAVSLTMLLPSPESLGLFSVLAIRRAGDRTSDGWCTRYAFRHAFGAHRNKRYDFHRSRSKLFLPAVGSREEFFKEMGTPVATHTAPPPKVDAAQEAAFFKKVIELAPKYRTAQRSEVCTRRIGLLRARCYVLL